MQASAPQVLLRLLCRHNARVFITVWLHQQSVRKAQQATAEVRDKSGSDDWMLSIAECGSYGTSCLPALSCAQPESSKHKSVAMPAGSPPRLVRFWPQLLEFTTCVVLARAVCGLVVSQLHYVLADQVCGLLTATVDHAGVVDQHFSRQFCYVA